MIVLAKIERSHAFVGADEINSHLTSVRHDDHEVFDESVSRGSAMSFLVRISYQRLDG